MALRWKPRSRGTPMSARDPWQVRSYRRFSSGLDDIGVDRVHQGLDGSVRAPPAERRQLVTAESHDRYVTLPTARAASVFILNISQSHSLDYQVGYFAHRDIV